MLDDMPTWFRPKLVGIAVVVLLALAILGMVLTSDRTAYASLETLDTNRSVAQSTARLATYQIMAFAVTIPTLLLLGWTLLETRRATSAANASLELARQMSVLEFKPYLRVTDSQLDKIVDHHGEVKARFGFSVKNVGKSAAYGIGRLEFIRYDILTPNFVPDPTVSVKRFEVLFPEPVPILNPGDEMDFAGVVVFNTEPSFGRDVAPCYQICARLQFTDMSTLDTPGTRRMCTFQLQRTPVRASDTLEGSDIETKMTNYLHTDEIKPFFHNET